MSGEGVLFRHGRAMAQHARLVTFVVLLVAVAGYLVSSLGVGGPSLFSRLEVGEVKVSGEAWEGRDLLMAQSPVGPSLQAIWGPIDPAAPATAQGLAGVHAALDGSPGIARVVDPTNVGPAAVSTDGHSVLVTVYLAADLTDTQTTAAEDAVHGAFAGLPDAVAGSKVRTGGISELVQQVTDQVETDLRTGEGIALPVSLVVMVLIFGGFAAAGVPLAGAFAAIAGALTSLLAWSYVVDLDATVVNVVTVLGLGLSIDYSLLIVNRYREEIRTRLRAAGLDPDAQPDISAEVRREAMGATMATAGRTVLFSGMTVAIAVLGLLFIEATIIRSVGVGAVSVVLVAVAVATTLVPALLVLATRHIAGRGSLHRVPGLRRLSASGDGGLEHGGFARWAAAVQRRAVPVFLIVTTVLVALSIPAWRMNLVSSGAELLPPGASQRDFYFDVQDDFPALASPPITIVARSADADRLADLAAEVADYPGVDRVGRPTPAGDLVSVGVFVEGSGQGEAAKQTVDRIRAERPDDVPTWVIGQAAQLQDFMAALRVQAPWAVGFVVVATFILLFLLTGSVFVPAKALIMNLLSLGATFGILVLIFQDGRFQDVLGYESTGGIESMLPVIIFAFAFGLSMDYEVFLLSRIKEFHDAGEDNDAAVRHGLQRTGRIITSAAALIVIVFAGFIVGQLIAIKQTGIALAVAVLLDATLVRVLLVPATMTLLGEWNWWAPRPLRALYRRFGMTH